MSNLSLGKLFDIEVELHSSWFFIFLLLAYSLSTAFFPAQFPGLENSTYWIYGLASSLLLFASVLAHELSHSLVAKHNNIKVDKITLFFFGGVAQIHDENINPGAEFRMALAGPMFSIALGGAFFLLHQYITIAFITPVFFYLYRINLILGIFNLVPGYPLDGGRVFRAVLWKFTGNVQKATYYASTLGRAFAFFLIFMGFAGLFISRDFGGLWFIILGFFLLFLAKVSYQQVLIKEILSKMKVKDLMKEDIHSMPAKTLLKTAVDDFFLKFDQEVFPIFEKESFVGILQLNQVQKIPSSHWLTIKVRDIALPGKKLPRLSEKESAYKAYEQMTRNSIALLPVMKKGKVVGVIDLKSMMHFLSLKLEFGKL